MDKRHIRRIHIIQEIYASAFIDGKLPKNFDERTYEVLKYAETFNDKIEDVAKRYSVDKIAKVDLSILRLALFELLVEKKIPPKVIINEAVELAKELGGEKSPSFINAVLGKIYESEKESKEDERKTD